MKNRSFKLSTGVITLICTLLVLSVAIVPAVYAVSTAPAAEPLPPTVTTVGNPASDPAPAPADDSASDVVSGLIPSPAAPEDEPAAPVEDTTPVADAAPAVDTTPGEDAEQSEEIIVTVPSEEGGEDEIVLECAEIKRYAAVTPADTATLEKYVDIDALHEYLRDAFMNFETTIYVNQFGISETDYLALFHYIWYSMPECFHLTGTIWRASSGGKLYYIKVEYAYTRAEFEAEMAKCDYATDWILSGLVGNDELSDVDKALLIHDRLALWCEYDMRLYSTGVPDKSYDMNGALADGVAVCQGYSMAYMYLLDLVDIDSYYVTSDALNHGWNVVYIDGIPYHVDVTWDDPINDITGRVLHTNFLTSTANLHTRKQGITDYDRTPTDTRYDNAYWRNSETAFQYLNGSLYYIYTPNVKDKEYEGFLCRVTDGKTEQLFEVSNRWDASTEYGAGYTWRANFTRLACDGVNLLYSTPTAVYEYNPISDSKTLVWSPKYANYEIYGFTWRDGEMICDLYYTTDFSTGTGEIEMRQARTISRIPGDADGDGTVAPMDAALLQQYLNGLDVEIKSALCDVDGDGQITMRDLIMIRQYANAIKVTLK